MREVVLRLALKNYERARDVVGVVADRAERTLDRARALSGELRGALERSQKLAESRAKAPGPADDSRRLGQAFGRANQAREKAELLGRLAFDNPDASKAIPSLMMGLAPFVPGIGPFLALLAPLTDKLLSHLDERLKTELDKREKRLLARLDDEQFLADYGRRLADDPRFARQEARRALDDALAEEALRGKRLEPYSADLSLADYGL